MGGIVLYTDGTLFNASSALFRLEVQSTIVNFSNKSSAELKY